MEILARVVSERLHPHGEARKRSIELEWSEDKTEKNPYPIRWSMSLDDNDKEFALGDTVVIRFTKVGVGASVPE